MAVPTSILYIEQQDGAAHGSYSAWLFSVFDVFLLLFVSQTRSVLPGMNC